MWKEKVKKVLNKFLGNKKKWKFRLMGVPPRLAIRYIECSPDISVFELKRKIQKEYQINPILAIQLLFKMKILPDALTLGKIAFDPRKDIISIMATQAGGVGIPQT